MKKTWKLDRFAYVYCLLRQRHPNWTHKQLGHATAYAIKK